MIIATALIAFLTAIQPAIAHPTTGPALPTVSHGSSPYRSFFGEFADDAGGNHELAEIPEGQDFIITGYDFDGNGGRLEVRRGAETVIDSTEYGMWRYYVSSGVAKLRIAGGTTLTVNRAPDSGALKYYLQGYFVASESPLRFAFGRTSPGGLMPVWTADSGRDFLIRTMMTGTSWCNYYVDGVAVSSGSFPFDGGETHGMFTRGRGAFVLPAGATLSMEHGMGPAETCGYFIEGQYIEE